MTVVFTLNFPFLSTALLMSSLPKQSTTVAHRCCNELSVPGMRSQLAHTLKIRGARKDKRDQLYLTRVRRR
jgi:hypothetical protein